MSEQADNINNDNKDYNSSNSDVVPNHEFEFKMLNPRKLQFKKCPSEDESLQDLDGRGLGGAEEPLQRV